MPKRYRICWFSFREAHASWDPSLFAENLQKHNDATRIWILVQTVLFLQIAASLIMSTAFGYQGTWEKQMLQEKGNTIKDKICRINLTFCMWWCRFEVRIHSRTFYGLWGVKMMCEGLVFSNVSILIYLMYVEICVKVCDINCWYSSLYCDWSSERKFFQP